jgi:uncharacterized DUF497 family protein
MSDLSFEWDGRKNLANQGKHGVSFREAASVFADEEGLLIGDPDRIDDEDRSILLGHSAALRLLVVVHCYRESDAVIRIISAHMATKAERSPYRPR